MSKTVIEDESTESKEKFVSLVSELAHLESFNRHLYRPGAYMHKWWARRCGTTFRAILKYLNNPDEFDYYGSDGLAGRTVFDPMMGGGTTVYEACRLGADTIGVDIDPVSTLLVKAGLKDVDTERLKEQFYPFFQSVRSKVKGFWETNCSNCDREIESKFHLLARKVECDCPEQIHKIDQNVLYERKEDPNIKLCQKCGVIHPDADHSCSGDLVRFVQKSQDVCPNCNSEFSELISKPFYERFTYVAERIDCECGVIFQRCQKDHEANRKKYESIFEDEFFEVKAGKKSDALVNRNIDSFLDTFSTPQLAFYATVVEEFSEIDEDLKFPFALLISTSTEFNNLLCGYKGQSVRRPGAVRHVFSHHAYDLPWVSLENNPVLPEKSSGNLKLIFENRILKGIDWRYKPRERDIRGEGWEILQENQVAELVDDPTEIDSDNSDQKKACIMQTDATDLSIPEDSIDFIVTDPPYYDSVQYSDLSQFFRGWLETLVPDGANWNFETEGNLAYKSLDGPKSFGENLGSILGNAIKGLKPDGKVAFTYHHWKADAWSALTIACQKAGLQLEEFIVTKSENTQSVHINGMKSLKHDAVLIFTPSDFKSGTIHRSKQVDNSKSEGFVWECANHLGELLKSEHTDYEDVKKSWDRKIEEITPE